MLLMNNTNDVVAVHYKGLVHCDVKMANVLVQFRDGQYRGVLTDFDLSKNDNTRRQEASRNAISMSQASGPCGTLGALTMAPEVSEGNTPDALFDVWSFGGMVMASLFHSQAKDWQTAQWQSDGTPILKHVENNSAKDLLVKLLHKGKHKRITSMQAVLHPFFSADHQVLELQNKMQMGNNELDMIKRERERQEKEREKMKKEMEKVIICFPFPGLQDVISEVTLQDVISDVTLQDVISEVTLQDVISDVLIVFINVSCV
jgi:serine/threonine protein kinase